MFDASELATTIDIQNRSYKLLLWFDRRLRDEKVTANTAHGVMSLADISADWIKRFHNNIPASFRPATNEIDAYSHILASYLQTSFEIVEGNLPQKHDVHWYCCMMCAYVRHGQFLKPRKVSPNARKDAVKLKLLYLRTLVEDIRLPLLPLDLERFLEKSSDLAHDLSLVTYANELLRRSKFASQGLAVLVLWRDIAWDGNSPNKNFSLSADAVLEAESRIVNRLKVFYAEMLA